MKRVWLQLLALILVSALPAGSQVPDQRLLVPGERIGNLTLQMTINQLAQIHGNPDRTSRSAPLDSAIPDPTIHQWNRLGVVAATSGQDARTVLLGTTSNEYRTTSG